MSGTNWDRVTAACPCRICNHADWCLVARDRTAAICARVESSRRAGSAGYLHRLRGNRQSFSLRCERDFKPSLEIDWTGQIAEAQRQTSQSDLHQFAQHLGVAPQALKRLQVVRIKNAWGFPHQDGRGRYCGIHLRLPSGFKPYIRGSRPGVVVPTDLGECSPLVITEGESDCAAALTLGVDAVARPGCGSSQRAILDFINLRKPSSIVMIGDSDDPGRRGAEQLSAQLLLVCRDVRVAFPPIPHKDLRAWLGAGATKQEFQALIQGTSQQQLKVIVRLRNRSV